MQLQRPAQPDLLDRLHLNVMLDIRQIVSEIALADKPTSGTRS